MAPSSNEFFLFDVLAFAADKHRDQRRKDVAASPYINHPIALGRILTEAGVDDPVTLAVALLHDTVEDTETTRDELVERFGETVAACVMEVTDDLALPKSERKQAQIDHAAGLSDRAKLVKLADKIANLRDVATSPPAGWSLQRRQEYFDWAKKVVDGLRGIHPALEAVFDQTCNSRPTSGQGGGGWPWRA